MKEPKQLVDVVKALDVTIECERRSLLTDDERANWKDGSAWTVRLKYQGRSLTTSFFQGSAHKTAPSAADVLACLASDARSGEESFEDFCGSFGYDADSRKAHTTWKACAKMTKQLRRLLGDAFDAVADAEH
jgi:hypothetical protein